MPDAAIRQVVDALKVKLLEIPGLSVFIDRGDLEPLTEGEGAWPAALIFVADMDFTQPELGGNTLHDCTIEIEVQSGGTEIGTIDISNMNTVASINNKITEDYTLGGILQDCDVESAGGTSQTDTLVGAANVRVKLSFWTRRNDFFTLI